MSSCNVIYSLLPHVFLIWVLLFLAPSRVAEKVIPKFLHGNKVPSYTTLIRFRSLQWGAAKFEILSLSLLQRFNLYV